MARRMRSNDPSLHELVLHQLHLLRDARTEEEPAPGHPVPEIPTAPASPPPAPAPALPAAPARQAGAELQPYLEALRVGKGKAVAKAKKALALAGEPAIAPVVDLLKARRPGTRRAAIEVLAKIGPKAVEAAKGVLERAMSDPDDSVRTAALDALLSHRPGGRAVVLAAWEAASAEDRVLLLEGLDARRPAIRVLVELALSDPSPEVRIVALSVATDTEGVPELQRAVVRALSDPQRSVRQAATLVLPSLDGAPRDVFPDLLRAARDRNPLLRLPAANLLQANVTADDAGPILELSRDPEPLLRQSAAIALGGLGERGADALFALLGDPDLAVRRAAAKSLPLLAGGLDADEPFPRAGEVAAAVARCFEDRDPELRALAARVVPHLAQAAGPAIGPLVAAATATSSSRFVRPLVGLARFSDEALLCLVDLAERDPEWDSSAQRAIAGRSTEEIEALLLRPEPAVRRQAVRVLAGQSEHAALERAARDADPSVRVHALAALDRVDSVRELAESPDVVSRRAAVEAIADQRPDVDPWLDMLRKALADPDPDVRFSACRVARDACVDELGWNEVLPSLVDDPIRRPRALAMIDLTFGDVTEGLLRSVEACLDDPRPEVRSRSLHLLAGADRIDDRASRVLIEGLAAGDRKMRASFGATARDLSSPALARGLIALLDSADEGVRQDAIDLLLEEGDAEVVEGALADPSPRVRQWAAWILGELGAFEEADRTALLASTTDEDPFVRRAAVLGLDATDPDASAALFRLLVEPDAVVRAFATTALGATVETSVESVVALAAMLSDRVGGVRKAAVHALGRMAATQEGAYQAILGAADDPAPGVRSAVADALVASRRADPEIRTLLARFAGDEDERVRTLAAIALGRTAE